MKAAILTEKQKFEIRELPDSQCPKNGLVLKVEACGICGSDLRRWIEGPPSGVENLVPGHEFSGVVSEVGKNLTGYQVNDRLAVAPDIHCGECYYCLRNLYNLCDNLRFVGITPGYPGGFAEKVILTSEILKNGIVHKMPEDLSFEEGALAEPCCSVLASLHRIHTSLGETMVVMGAGPIGCLHVIVGKSRGAKVVISEPSEIRRKYAERFEPDGIVDPNTENLVESVFKSTNGVGADVVVCANPVAATHTIAVELVRKRGKVILFGGLPKDNPFTTLDANKIHYGEIEILGAFSYHPAFHKLALDLLARKVIPARKIITNSFFLEEIDHAFNSAAKGSELKVMIKMEK
jgi:L-iditol 2-dehydrogenase